MIHSQTLTSQTSNPWTQILAPGPPPRDSYASVLWEDYIVIFGGSSDMIPYNDVYAFNLVTQTWIQPRQTGSAIKAVARSGHSMCLDQKGNFIIFGGLNDNGKLNWYTGFNLDISESGELTIKWQKLPKTDVSYEEDKCPCVAFHTANVYNNKMYVFGGLNERDVRVNELWELDLDTFIWRKPETIGNKPDPLFAHCSVICKSKLYIFGQNSQGRQFYAFDLETFQWDRIETTGLPTNVRSGAVMQEYKGKLYLFGGGAQGCTSDLFVFCSQTNTWSQIHLPEELPAVRSLYNLIIYKNRLYILGGKGYERSAPLDFWSLCLDNIDLDPAESDQTKILKIQNDPFDLFELFTQKSFTDIILEVEGREFPCHKAILAQRCKFFANLFNSGMSDSNLTRLPIMGVKVDSFEIMLRFIYGDPNLTIEEDLAFELLSMSDKYLLPTLKTECEKVLIKLLDLDNFTKIAKAAEVVESDELKKVVFKFAIQNVNTLKEKGDLYNLSQSLLIELFADIVSK